MNIDIYSSNYHPPTAAENSKDPIIGDLEFLKQRVHLLEDKLQKLEASLPSVPVPREPRHDGGGVEL